MAKAAERYNTDESPTLEAHPDKECFRMVIWDKDQGTGSRWISDIYEFHYSFLTKQIKPKSRKDVGLFGTTFTADEGRAALAEYVRRSNERD